MSPTVSVRLAVLATAFLVLVVTPTVFAQSTSNPRVGPWGHRVCKCTNWNNASTWAQDCRLLDGGTWLGATSGGCVNMAHPQPWALESLIEPKVSIREGGQSTHFTGWQSPGQQTSCTGCWSGGLVLAMGIESSNLGIVDVGDASVIDYMARRDRTVTCPQGYSWNGTTCTLPAGALTLHKNNDVCPASPNGSNPVNSSTGRKLQRETDYVGTGPFPLEFKRYYSNGVMGFSGNTHIRFGGLGTNWRHTYSREVILVNRAGAKTATVVRPNGNEYFFNESAQGNWIGDADVAERLEAIVDSGDIIGWLYHTTSDEIEEYDSKGRLIQITNREGFTQTLSYDLTAAEGGDDLPQTLDRVTGPFGGRSLHFTYGGDGKIARMTVMPGGEVFRFEYSTRLLTKVYYPDENDDPADPTTYNDNPTRQYAYNESGYVTGSVAPASLTGIFDENGTRYASWWYSGDRVVRSQLAPNDLANVNRVDFQYHANGTRTITDAAGKSRLYGFQIIHGVAKIGSIAGGACEACGSGAQSVTYDANGYRDLVTDFNGNVTDYDYDSRGLEVQRIEAKGTADARTVRTEWHPTLRVPTRISIYTGEGTSGTHLRQTTLSYSDGRLTGRSETDVASGATRTWTYSYDGSGLLLAVDGPRTDVADVTTYQYVQGDLVRITNSLSQITEILARNAHGQPLTVVDPNGVVTTFTYDARQRLTSRTTAGETVSFEYWPTGLLKKVVLPDTSYVSYLYDAAHRLVEMADAGGNRIIYTLDAMGNRVGEEIRGPSGALARAQTRVFDDLNRLWKQIGAAGTQSETTTFGYDGVGNLTDIWAPLGRDVSQIYDALSRLREIVDPEGGVTGLAYDELDNLIAVTDPRGITTDYSHNGFGELELQTSPDSGATTYAYDAAGNLWMRTDARGRTAVYSYDVLNRVTQSSYADQTVTFSYDVGTNGTGRLTGASDANHSTTWEYDGLGRVTYKEQVVDSVTQSIAYGFADGNMTSVVLPSGNALSFSYANGRPTSITLNSGTTILHQVRYEPFGPVSGWTWGNGTVTTRAYDLDGNVRSLHSAEGYEYDYDSAFRVTGITAIDKKSPASNWSYTYDLLDRLKTANRSRRGNIPPLVQNWTYDGTGNRLAESGSSSSTYVVAPNSNRLTAVSGAVSRSFSHDAAGNVTSDGFRSFAYNDAGRMVSATGSVTTSYVYNAAGERIRKSSVSGTRYFFYDEAGRLVGEYDQNGLLIQETVWLEDTPVATLQPNGSGGVDVLYVHTDHLNTPRRITRPGNNAIVWRWDSDPFGTSAAYENPVEYNLRFPGQYYDEETGLHYNYFRDYDPTLGRYIQSDPIGLDGGLNTYTYVNGNPISLTDPLGLAPPKPLPPERQRRRECKSAEYSSCQQLCGSRGVQSCKVNQTFSVQGIKNGLPYYGWKDGPMSCSCNNPEGFCGRNPTTCAFGVAAGVCILLLTPFPDDVLIPALIGAAAASQ